MRYSRHDKRLLEPVGLATSDIAILPCQEALLVDTATPSNPPATVDSG